MPNLLPDNIFHKEYGNTLSQKDIQLILKSLVRAGDLDTLNYLLQYNIFSASIDYKVLVWAIKYNQSHLINHLLNFYKLFDFINKIEKLNTNVSYAFFSAIIQSLRLQKEEFERLNPDKMFNITQKEQVISFLYILRNLISLNSEVFLEDIRFLLTIPALRDSSHERVNFCIAEENQLYGLALAINHQKVVDILLEIPKIRIIAEKNNYYRDKKYKILFNPEKFNSNYKLNSPLYDKQPEFESFNNIEFTYFVMQCLLSIVGILLLAAIIITSTISISSLGAIAATTVSLGTLVYSATMFFNDKKNLETVNESLPLKKNNDKDFELLTHFRN